MRSLMLLFALLCAMVVGISSASAADLSATPSTFASVYANANAGDTITLAAGNYGNWAGGTKSVTIKGGSGSTIGVAFSSANGVTIDGPTITGGQIEGTSKNITIANSNFTGLFRIETSSANANIVLDHNTHINLNACSTCLPARVTVWSQGSPSGVTIKNSLFKGGDADGVRPDADQVQVLNNEFADLFDRNCSTCNHTDPIQFYGATRAVVRGNYFHNDNGNISAYIMQADGGQGNVIEDNVFASISDGGAGSGHGYGYAITLNSDNGSVIRHNTFQRGVCDFNIPCGTISIGNKSGQPVGKGTIIRDNIIGSIQGGNGTYTSDHNMVTSASSGNFVGSPTYSNPMPSSYSDYRLATGSFGTGMASDGLDIGVRFSVATPTPTPTPSPTPTATPSPTPTATPSPTPEPYSPKCAPTCDEDIAALQDKLDAALAKIEAAKAALQ